MCTCFVIFLRYMANGLSLVIGIQLWPTEVGYNSIEAEDWEVATSGEETSKPELRDCKAALSKSAASQVPVRTKSDKPCRLQKFKLCSGLIKKQGFKGSFGEAVSSAKFGLGFTVCGDVESKEINEDMSIDASKQSDENEQALGAANTLAKKAGGSNFPDIADGLDELNMDDYDDEDDR
ncbi:hypothetical protein SSX86_022890 [Deinandra increscens subsp. villosa]|uniref:Uncharacterized protein n=1 Tax=Deinandra increscens subsp. villosa TaxID=3103831 RepID=A0AAP0GSX6_9ASTR